jgi:cyclopropane fatty-acyl-phospholipid synthase-like methyltransferase
MSLVIPFSEACERNKDAILETISPFLQEASSVLEIGSGTAQHAVYFARNTPHLSWQTSDQAQYIEGISAQLQNAEVANVMAPLQLDVRQTVWCESQQKFDLIYSANTLHIMSWDEVACFFTGLAAVSQPEAYLIFYGPFKYQGEFTSESNRQFDQILRARGVGSAIRDFEEVNQLAQDAGLSLVLDQAMPANNQCIIWQNQQLA